MDAFDTCLETRLGRLRVTRADQSNIDTIHEIMIEGSRWIQSMGFSQPAWLFTDEGRKVFSRTIEEREVYIAVKDDEVVATLWLCWDDEDSWDTVGADGLAGYVHGFAVKRCYGGNGIGERLLNWAERLIIHRGRRFIRLDCQGDNPGICAYYERNGFEARGVKWKNSVPHRRYEKKLDLQRRSSQ